MRSLRLVGSWLLTASSIGGAADASAAEGGVLQCLAPTHETGAVYNHVRTKLDQASEPAPDDVVGRAWGLVLGGLRRSMLWVDRAVHVVPLVWSEAVFEVDGVRPEERGAIVLAQEPYLLQQGLCQAVLALFPAHSGHPALQPICGYTNHGRGAEMEGRRLSAPCKKRTPLASGGTCECIEAKCIVRASPFRRPCVNVGISRGDIDVEARTEFGWATFSKEGLPDGLRAFTPTYYPKHVAYLLAGILALSIATPLSESVLVHYSVAMLLGTTVAAAFIAFAVYRQLVGIMPAGRVVHNVAVLSLVSAPLSLVFYQDTALWVARLVLTGSLAFWDNGVLGYRWVGKAYFLLGAALGVILTERFGVFRDEPPTTSLFRSWTNGQANIRRMVSGLGLYWLLLGTSDLEVSAVLALLMCYLDTVLYWRFRLRMWLDRSPESSVYRGHRLTPHEYDMLGERTTQLEMEKLKAHLKETKYWKGRLQEDSQRRVKMFVDDYPHVSIPDGGADSAPRRWPRCSIQ